MRTSPEARVSPRLLLCALNAGGLGSAGVHQLHFRNSDPLERAALV